MKVQITKPHKLIRRIQLSLNESNSKKLDYLNSIMIEFIQISNIFVDELWQRKSCDKFSKIKTKTWLSASFQQLAIKRAADVNKLILNNKIVKKIKPVIKNKTIDLDSRFLTFKENLNSFDFWIHISRIGQKIILNLPTRKHKHFLKFQKSGWTMRKGGRLRKTKNDKWFLDVYFEKDESMKKTKGKDLGLDTGYKKLITDSNGKTYDVGLEKICEKISRKKQGSKAFKRALTERNQAINRSVNQIRLRRIKKIVVENLKNIKRKSKGRICKQFNNKLQRWSYPRVLAKLQMVCEENRIEFLKVDPAYTSQTCSLCGHVDSKSRLGETFKCTRCGMKMDADVNAAKNILQRGVYSPSSGGKPL